MNGGRDRTAAYDEILNGLFFQQRNEVEKVGTQAFRRRGFGKSPPWRRGVRAEWISIKDFLARGGFPMGVWTK